MNKRLQLFAEHIALGNPEALAAVARANRYPVPKSDQGRVGFIYEFLKRNGEEAMKELVLIHPDRDIILASETGKTSNADGTPAETIIQKIIEPAKTTADERPKLSNLLLLFVLAILLIAILNGKI